MAIRHYFVLLAWSFFASAAQEPSAHAAVPAVSVFGSGPSGGTLTEDDKSYWKNLTTFLLGHETTCRSRTFDLHTVVRLSC